MTRMLHASLVTLVLLQPACPAPGPAVPAALARPAGAYRYRFTSSQRSPAGLSRVQLEFTLQVNLEGQEVARVTSYQRANGDAPLVAGVIDSLCSRRLRSLPGVIVELPITPPPSRLADLIPPCVPEDLFGAASDILPLLMIQVQPRYRAAELRHPGDRLTFEGYRTGWRQPPSLLDAVIVADSGVVSWDSLSPTHRVLGWNTSPMRVTLIRQLAPGQRMRLRGQEWFRAQVAIDTRGVLLRGHTLLDSLALRVTLPYRDTLIPGDDSLSADTGPLVAVSRSLALTLLPD